jgi:chromosome segregation ATPase
VLSLENKKLKAESTPLPNDSQMSQAQQIMMLEKEVASLKEKIRKDKEKEEKKITFQLEDNAPRFKETFRQADNEFYNLGTLVAKFLGDMQSLKNENEDLKRKKRRFKDLELDLQNARQQIKELKSKITSLEKKRDSLLEKIENKKDFSNIVKSSKNVGEIAALNQRLSESIRYVENTIELLRTL